MSRLEYLYDIEFKGKTSKSFGLVFRDSPKIITAGHNYVSTKINGRVGDIITSFGGRSNATIECDFWVVSDDIHESFRQLNQWLCGNGKLRFSDNSNAFYEVLKVDSVQVEKKMLKYGRFLVKFVVFPYEFLDDGQMERNNIEINPHSECMPYYMIAGNGVCTLTVNGKTFKANVPGYLKIDSRRMQTVKADGANANTLVNGNYEDLWLPNGDVSISVTEGFELKIIPNWGYLL